MGADSCRSSRDCIESHDAAAMWEQGSGHIPILPLCSGCWARALCPSTAALSSGWMAGEQCLWGLFRAMCYFSWPSFPVAAVSPVLDCGYCLIGGMKITRFICKNVGFSVGKFCIMPKKSWPPSSFRVSDHRLLPGKRANPSKEITPVRDLVECAYEWKHKEKQDL